MAGAAWRGTADGAIGSSGTLRGSCISVDLAPSGEVGVDARSLHEVEGEESLRE
jgi:hypothetical protein